VGSGYLSNEGETKGRSNFMSHKEYNSPFTLVFKVFKERGKRKVVGKKRLVLAFLDFESMIANALAFPQGF
jgi:hypothetical protein